MIRQRARHSMPRCRRNRRNRDATCVNDVSNNVVVAMSQSSRLPSLSFLSSSAAFFGVRMVKHLRQMNANGSQIQIEDYTGSGDKDTTFTVETGQGAAEIARNLVKADIVKSESAFTSAVAAAGATLYPGSYALKTHMKAADVVKILSDQSKAGGFAEVKAGERVSDVIANAAKMSGKDVSEFQAVIDGGGAGILPDEAGGKFEGWLEPDPTASRTSPPRTSSRKWSRHASTNWTHWACQMEANANVS